jgi:hypothetical protein
MYFSPNDNPVDDDVGSMKDSNFGGQRQFTTGKQVRNQDYTKKHCGAPNTKKNPVEDAVRDVDAMTNEETRKREFSRRAETSASGDHNKEHFHKTDPENRPLEDTTAIIPDDKKHGDKLRNQFGSGQYDNNPNRGSYEGENR